MARIPVERDRGGSPWWLWLIGLLVLVGIIWIIAELFERDTVPTNEVAEGATEQVQPVAPMATPNTGMEAGTITDLDTVLAASDKAALAGRPVQLDSLKVTSVVGDSTFYVTPVNAPDTDRRMFVVLEEQIPAPPDPVEGRYNVTPGQILSLSGTLDQVRSDDPQRWGITGQEAQQLQNDQVYLRAQRLDVSQQPNQ